MIKTNNYITALLILIVIMLLIGVGIAVYYVLDLDWFDKTPVEIYNEVQVYQEQSQCGENTKKEVKYNITKRTYNLVLENEELKVVVYKDGTVGITMLKNEKNEQVDVYKEIVNKEIKLDLTNIIRVYEVTVSKDVWPTNHILLLDVDGNLYALEKQELMTKGKYSFNKIEGLAKIIDVRQINNEGLTENVEGMNAIAIDEESNELLITDYLIK